MKIKGLNKAIFKGENKMKLFKVILTMPLLLGLLYACNNDDTKTDKDVTENNSTVDETANNKNTTNNSENENERTDRKSVV